VDGRKCEELELRGGERVQFGSATVFKFEFRDEVENEFATSLYESATRDRLTGAFNRRHLSEQLANEFSWHRRHAAPMSIIFLDLDHFKRINDDYGHLTGDEILRQAATRILGEKRDEDMFARYGGEEFACIFEGQEIENVWKKVDQCREALSQRSLIDVESGKAVGEVTFSAGLAQCLPTDTKRSILRKSDLALYEAKSDGRNRVLKYSNAR